MEEEELKETRGFLKLFFCFANKYYEINRFEDETKSLADRLWIFFRRIWNFKAYDFFYAVWVDAQIAKLKPTWRRSRAKVFQNKTDESPETILKSENKLKHTKQTS